MRCNLALATLFAIGVTAQGVTSRIEPTGDAPTGCEPSHAKTFGIAALLITDSHKRGLFRRDPTVQAVTQKIGAAVSQIKDGQVQIPKSTIRSKTSSTTSSTKSSTKSSMTVSPTKTSSGPATTKRSTGRANVRVAAATKSTTRATTGVAVSQIKDGQVQIPIATPIAFMPAAKRFIRDFGVLPGAQAAPAPLAAQQIQLTGESQPFVSADTNYCQNEYTLNLTLADGILKDSLGRTAYIAGNYQFQFDDPPQTGAIITAGFADCGGVLALGPQNVFWRCSSGGFYNIYDRNFASQCEPIYLTIVDYSDDC